MQGAFLTRAKNRTAAKLMETSSENFNLHATLASVGKAMVAVVCHMLFAWASLISVGFTDFYIRMLASGAFKDIRFL